MKAASRATHLALAAAVAVGLGAVVATVWVGSSVYEETVVAKPYQERLRRSDAGKQEPATAAATPCDAGLGTCERALPGGGGIVLDLGPRPLGTMREFDVRVELKESPPPDSRSRGPSDGPTRVRVSFAMPGMYMGENRVELAPAGPGRFLGKAVLVRCSAGRTDWIADVEVVAPGAPPRIVRFDLSVER